MIEYKYSEDEFIDELTQYVNKTYGEHYAQNNKVQTTEYIMSQFENGEDFLRGNALKYLSRYGIKEGHNKKDLMKAMHYIMLLLHFNKHKHNDKVTISNDNTTK